MAVPRFWREQPQRYRLLGASCPSCKKVYFPPRPVCPTCRRESVGKMRPLQLSGQGEIVTWTIVHQPADGFELQAPYVMAIVELVEGCRVMTQIVETDPALLRPGLAVEACFRRIREDGKGGVIYYGYKFRLPRTKPAKPPVATSQARAVPKRAPPRGRR